MQQPTAPLLIFAAGFGARMGALTANRPKPLVHVAGRPLIDHALDVAEKAGILRPVINLHYLADQLVAHLKGRNVEFSHERDQILETGGGLKAALPLLGDGPVLTLNSDGVWMGQNPLLQLLAAWDAARMDALLLLLPIAQAAGHGPKSDFILSEDGRIARANGASGHAFIGASMINPACLAAIPDPVFSLNRPWDLIIAAGRAFGLEHQGDWCDVGTPDGIATAETLLHAWPHA
ncbi:nucleotidyltransferase family protein [Tabrizicola sp.]|uniref:nucleotidyltransferase family protein n=1 Tax=Tabrizicola sp. TaxID=2005166 RepID=UPI00286D30CF|nr:nucleotidyltransferase family protein [Tabrizicola sp.]